MTTDPPTIHDWAGGRASPERWLNACYDRVEGDDLLSQAADDVGLPADPEFRAAIVGYAEWGTRLAAENSAADAKPVEQAPVPRWGWGVAPPYDG